MDYRQLRKALVSKLKANEESQSHHVFYVLCYGDRSRRIAKLSHSSKGQAPQFILSDTAKRLKLKNAELLEFVKCTISRETVIRTLSESVSQTTSSA